MTTPQSSEFSAFAIAELTISPYSVRGLTERIELDFEPQIVRNWNGDPIDVTPPQFKKYRVTVQVSDMDSPPLDGVFTGMTLTIDCVTEFCYETASAGGSRTAVSGSERFDTDNNLTFYRPQLDVMVESYTIDTDEAGAVVGWTLVMIEV